MDWEGTLQAGVPELVVIATKCTIPQTNAALVARPRLFALLDQGLRRKLTLVSAPAGFGKTTLLADWLAEKHKAASKSPKTSAHEPLPASSLALDPSRVAWLSLDASDNEPLRFWFYFSTALQHVQPALVARERGRVAATRSALAMLQGDMARAIALSQQALEQLPLADRILRTLIGFNLANAYHSLGDSAASELALEDAHSLSQTHDDPQSLLLVASMDMVQGRLHAAAGCYREIIRRASAQPVAQNDQASLALAYTNLGDLLYEWNDLSGAASYLQLAIEIGERRAVQLVGLAAMLALARVRQASGEFDAAIEQLQQAQVLAERHGSAQALGPIEAAWAWLALRQGRVAEAEQRAQRVSTSAYGPPDLFQDEVYGVQAQVQIALGQAERALEWLSAWRLAAQSGGRSRSLVRALVWESLAYSAAGDAAAYTSLRAALALAAPEGYIRTFADAGEPMRSLLAQLRDSPAHSSIGPQLARYLDQLLWTFESGGRRPPAQLDQQRALQALIEPLTERELAVLRCLAAGFSNTEIAAELSVAVSTVRSHIKSIYGKLGVRNRVEAVTAAQELRLLGAAPLPFG